MRATWLLPLLALLLGAAAPPLPETLNDPNTNEGWVWQQVQAGKIADMEDRCGVQPFDGPEIEDERWLRDCRGLDPTLLRALLTQPDLADRTPHGVQIRGARINGHLDLEDAHVRAAEVYIRDSWLDGDLVLFDTRLDGVLDLNGTRISGWLFAAETFIGGRLTLNGSTVDGPLQANSLHVGGSLHMRGTVFGKRVLLRDARIDGQLDMAGAKVTEEFDAQRLQVGRGGLYMRKVNFGGPVDLTGARADDWMSLDGASIAKDQMFEAQQLRVGAGGLALDNVRFGGPVSLRRAQVEGPMSLNGASVAPGQEFDAQQMRAGRVFLRDVTFGGPVRLTNARIDGSLELIGTKVAPDQPFNAQRLDVQGDILARNASFGGEVSLQLLHVGGILDLRGSELRVVHLEDASIGVDLLLGGRFDGSEMPAHWVPCDATLICLNLRNVRVGALQDDQSAWPARMTLEGFTYTQLGAPGGEGRQDMRNRPVAWWRDWLSRDPVYSAQPYAQLAGVLAAAGNRDGAADIRFFSRDRERSELLRGCTWLQALRLVERPDGDRPCGPERWATWSGLTVLQVFAGYGIGIYGFRAVGWALIFALIGTVILCFSPGVRGVMPIRFLAVPRRGPRQKSLLWCFGASLNRLLPLVTISQEFNDFFNDPRRERLHAWQQVAFGVLALCGWALGLFVVAAFSGLIQN